MNNISFFEWRRNYINGKYNSPDRQTMIDAGWYDWFCSDSSLKPKLDKMAKIVMKLGSYKFNWETSYVWFKNNCPVCYPLYDDFRIADLVTGDVIFTVQMLSEYTKAVHGANYVVFGRENDFKEPLYTCRTCTQLIDWFNKY